MGAGGAPGGRAVSVFLVAGEHSGDHLGAGLMRALRERRPDIAFAGVGGPAMIREGLISTFPMSDIAVMGFVPVIRRLPLILRRVEDAARAALAARPDILVLIDSPDFTHRVARRVRRQAPQMPVVDYVSPSVWAWRSGRAAAMRAYVDHVLALLPFEPEVHRRLGGPPCTYVGHPLVEQVGALRPDARERAERSGPNLLVLPGSRRSEIRRLSAVFGDTAGRIARALGPLDIVVPAVAGREEEVRRAVSSWPVKAQVVTGEAAKLAAFRRARAALVASGTATLELALSGVPMVVGYKVSVFEAWMKYVVQVPSMVLPNLILGRLAIKEYFQTWCEPERLTRALLPLLQGGEKRDAQVSALTEVGELMQVDAAEPPSGRAADIVLEVATRGRVCHGAEAVDRPAAA